MFDYALLEGLCGIMGILLILTFGYILFTNAQNEVRDSVNNMNFNKLTNENEQLKQKVHDLETGLNQFTTQEIETALERLYETQIIEQNNENLQKYFNKPIDKN